MCASGVVRHGPCHGLSQHIVALFLLRIQSVGAYGGETLGGGVGDNIIHMQSSIVVLDLGRWASPISCSRERFRGEGAIPFSF